MKKSNNSLAIIQLAVSILGGLLLGAVILGAVLAGGLGGMFDSPEVRTAKDIAAIEQAQLDVARARSLLPIITLAQGAVILALAGAACGLCFAAARRAIRWSISVYPASGLYPLVNDPALINYNEPGVQLAAARAVPASLTYTDRRTISAAASALPEPARAAQAAQLPAHIGLGDLGAGGFDWHSVLLGLGLNEHGQAEPVTADFEKLIHVGIGGSSGMGKSNAMRNLAVQLALSQTPVQLCLVDLEYSCLAPFENCNRLLYPLADTEQGAGAIFDALIGELSARRELYKPHTGVDSLDRYNAVSDTPLYPIVCLVDEATFLMGKNRTIAGQIETLAYQARKYGLWLVLAAQNWRAANVPPGARDMFATRLQYKAMSSSQSRILIDQSGAEDIRIPGRCLAVLPGRGLCEIQTPYVTATEAMRLLDGRTGQAARPLPEFDPPADDFAEQVKTYAAEGLNPSQIAEAVLGYRNSRVLDKIRTVLETSDR